MAIIFLEMNTQRAGAGSPSKEPIIPVEGLTPQASSLLGVRHEASTIGLLVGSKLAAAFNNGAKEITNPKPVQDVEGQLVKTLGRKL